MFLIDFYARKKEPLFIPVKVRSTGSRFDPNSSWFIVGSGMFSTTTIFRFRRSQKLRSDTWECRKLIYILILFTYHFEVAPISISSEVTTEKVIFWSTC
jgi:hypothetical protein